MGKEERVGKGKLELTISAAMWYTLKLFLVLEGREKAEIYRKKQHKSHSLKNGVSYFISPGRLIKICEEYEVDELRH